MEIPRLELFGLTAIRSVNIQYVLSRICGNEAVDLYAMEDCVKCCCHCISRRRIRNGAAHVFYGNSQIFCCCYITMRMTENDAITILQLTSILFENDAFIHREWI
jgi:hypothetical protein